MGERDAAINDWAIISWINADLLFRGILAAGSQFDRQSVIDATNTFTGWTSGGLLGPIDWTRQHNAPTPDDVVTNGPVQDCFSWVKVEAGDVVLLGDEEKPQFCWDPKAEGYEDPMPSTFAE
jgi:hypothetical protein